MLRVLLLRLGAVSTDSGSSGERHGRELLRSRLGGRVIAHQFDLVVLGAGTGSVLI